MENEVVERRIKLPNTRAYDRAGTGDHSLFSDKHCCICGKSVTDPQDWLLLSRASDGTFEFAILHPTDATAQERETSLWVAPIGSDCLRKNTALKPFVIGTHTASSSAPDSVNEAQMESVPLCPVHESLDKRGKLEMTIGGLSCVACSLAERAMLLDLLAPFAPKDASEDSLAVMRRLTEFYDTHYAEGRIVVSYPAVASEGSGAATPLMGDAVQRIAVIADGCECSRLCDLCRENIAAIVTELASVAQVAETAMICECGHSKPHHKWVRDHHECAKCAGRDEPCTEFRLMATIAPAETPPARNSLRLIAQERQRQISVEGWTPEHDASHRWGQMSIAAACYAVEGTDASVSYPNDDPEGSGWPWGADWWKPKDRVRNLVRAGALIAAEIDRQLGTTELVSVAAAETGWTQNAPTRQGWYYHWNGDSGSAVFPLSVLKHGAGTQECFVSLGQAGLSRSIECSEYGGWWKSLPLPPLPLESHHGEEEVE